MKPNFTDYYIAVSQSKRQTHYNFAYINTEKNSDMIGRLGHFRHITHV